MSLEIVKRAERRDDRPWDDRKMARAIAAATLDGLCMNDLQAYRDRRSDVSNQ